jgi:hypothetical protein
MNKAYTLQKYPVYLAGKQIRISYLRFSEVSLRGERCRPCEHLIQIDPEIKMSFTVRVLIKIVTPPFPCADRKLKQFCFRTVPT